MYYDIQGLVEGRAANTWIAPWPSYASSLSGCTQKDNIIQCSTGLYVNLTNMDAFVPTQQGNLNPSKFTYIDSNGTVRAMVWNSSDQEETVFFVDPNDNVISKTVSAKSFTVVTLS